MYLRLGARTGVGRSTTLRTPCANRPGVEVRPISPHRRWAPWPRQAYLFQPAQCATPTVSRRTGGPPRTQTEQANSVQGNSGYSARSPVRLSYHGGPVRTRTLMNGFGDRDPTIGLPTRCRVSESNRGMAAYKTTAVPLSQHGEKSGAEPGNRTLIPSLED